MDEAGEIALREVDAAQPRSEALCRMSLGDAELERKQVNLQVLDQSINTSDATGRLLFHMLGAIAQFETELRAERQSDGIQKAKAHGVRFGQAKKLTPLQIAELQKRRKQGALIKTLMQEYRLSKATVYRYLNQTDSALSSKHAENP